MWEGTGCRELPKLPWKLSAGSFSTVSHTLFPTLMAEELQTTQPALREASEPDRYSCCLHRWAQAMAQQWFADSGETNSLTWSPEAFDKERADIESQQNSWALQFGELISLHARPGVSFPGTPNTQHLPAALLSSTPNKSLQFYALFCPTISLSPPLWAVEMLSLCFSGLFSPWAVHSLTLSANLPRHEVSHSGDYHSSAAEIQPSSHFSLLLSLR